MKILPSWLADYTELPPLKELAEKLTTAGLESEVLAPPRIPDGVVTGRIVECEPHPNADRLRVCQVDVGTGDLRTIVCGAPNAAAGFVAAAALPGAQIGDFTIAERKLRGVQSQGMLCSESELGLSEEHDGIILLSNDTPIGVPLAEVLAQEPLLLTEPTSNRGDWMAVRGVAREIGAVTRVDVKLDPPRVEAAAVRREWQIEIENPAECPRYAGRVVEGLQAGPSPKWLSDRLVAAGVRPIYNLVDVTNYVLLEWGHPLHAFDLGKLRGKTIGVRRGKAGEQLTTLDDKERKITPDVLLITDESGPIAAAGVMGGASTKITEESTSVLLEGAVFAAPRVRAGARELRMATDASHRFERGVNPETVPAALDRAVELLLELCPGARLVDSVDAYPARWTPATVTLRRDTLPRVLGVAPAGKEVEEIFARLELAVKSASDAEWVVEIPSFRPDLTAEEDLVEEVARIYGYDRIPDAEPGHVTVQEIVEPHVVAQDRARRTLLSLGLTEVITPSLVEAAESVELTGAGASGNDFYAVPVPLRNPMSQDRNALRGGLVPSLLAVLETNLRHSTRDLALFEVGRTFGGTPETKVYERLRVGMLLAGDALQAGRVTMSANPCDFFDMKGLVEVYVEEFWASSLQLEAGATPPFAAGRSATVIVSDTKVGQLGELDSSVRERFDVPEDLPVLIAELDLEALPLATPEITFRELPRFPGVNRDLAFVVEQSISHDQLRTAITEAGGDWLQDVRVFDVYRGQPLAETEKSLAFNLVFRSADRSLTNDEVDGSVEKIVKHLANRWGARIR